MRQFLVALEWAEGITHVLYHRDSSLAVFTDC